LLFNYRISSAICRLFRVGLRRLPRCDGRKPPAANALAANVKRLPALAAELVQLQPEVIVGRNTIKAVIYRR
jgi:hypothetical protein